MEVTINTKIVQWFSSLLYILKQSYNLIELCSTSYHAWLVGILSGIIIKDKF